MLFPTFPPASGWLTTGIKLVADVLDNLLHRAATDFAILDFARAPVDDFVPLRFGVSVHGFIEAGDELVGKKRRSRSGRASTSAIFSAAMLMRS